MQFANTNDPRYTPADAQRSRLLEQTATHHALTLYRLLWHPRRLMVGLTLLAATLSPLPLRSPRSRAQHV